MARELGTFSITYRNLCDDEGGLIRAADWDAKYLCQWARSLGGDGDWQFRHGLDEGTYLAILQHFGLLYWTDEYPPERIFHKSPAWLAGERRKKEREFGLKFLVITNMSPCFDDCPAEEYE